MPGYNPSIQHIVDGEPVDAGTARRAAVALQANVEHIKNRLDLADLGQVLVTPELPLDPALDVGQPVYWNTATSRLEGAMARAVYDATLGTLVPAPEAEILGFIYQKPTAATAVVATRGWATLDIGPALGDGPTAGWYFLSPTTPGRLIKTPPNFRIPVLYSNGAGSVVIDPARRLAVDEHIHFSFPLTCAPAGDTEPPDTDDPHVITGADVAIAGWLPADHASFDGNAPEGAAFGYNLAEDASLDRVWPPYPLDAVSFTWDKGLSHVGGTTIPTTGAYPLITVTKHGIWWMSDAEDDVPWTNVEWTDGEATLAEPDEGDRGDEMRLTVHFSVSRYAASRTVVTSVRAAEGSFVQVTGCDGEPATTGDLLINTTLALSLDEEEDATGHLVVKEVTTDKKLKLGPVVGGLIAGANTTLTSTAETTETVGETPDVTVHRGFVTVSVPLSSSERELMPALVKLTDARDRFENGILFVGLPRPMASSIRCAFYVPPAGIADPNDIKFRLAVLGTTTGALPALTVTYRILQPASGTPQTPPSSDTATSVTMPTLTAGQYALVETPAISVPRGATVFFNVARAANDAYAGEVGLVRVSALLL